MSAKDRREIRAIVSEDGVPILTTIARLRKFRTRKSMTVDDLRELDFVLGDLNGQAVPVSILDVEEPEF